MKFLIAPEGWPFVIVFALLAVATGVVLRPWMAVFPVLLMCFMLFFFRDPERVVPVDAGVFVSPADGEVVLVKKVYEDRHLKADAIMISVFMSPFNVHVNRAPMDGVVLDVVHVPGKFMAAFKEEASLGNEHINMVMEGELGKILVRQVAGFLARRAVCRVKPGDQLKRGDKYGVIKFGSRLDIYLPVDTKISVAVNDRVTSGETILGTVNVLSRASRSNERGEE